MASEMLAHVLLMCGLQFVVDALCVLKVVAIVLRCRELEPSAASNRMRAECAGADDRLTLRGIR